MKESIQLYQLLKGAGVKYTGKLKKVDTAVKYYVGTGNAEPISVVDYYKALMVFAVRNRGANTVTIIDPDFD